MNPALTPSRLFRRIAIAEAITWGLLLFGMFLKYGTETTDVGVRIFGMAHGIVFIAYCLTTIVVGIDQRWSRGRVLLGLAVSIPPFFTVLFDRFVERRGAFTPAWRLTSEPPRGRIEALVSWLLRNPLRGALAGLVAVLALTGVALLVGPPAG